MCARNSAPTQLLPALGRRVAASAQPAGGGSYCEWKGPARYWSLVDGPRRLDAVAWSYPKPLAGAETLADCVAFYPTVLTAAWTVPW
ncbi:MAG: DUF427 domain-containing protein [Burkholderiales bacterium]